MIFRKEDKARCFDFSLPAPRIQPRNWGGDYFTPALHNLPAIRPSAAPLMHERRKGKGREGRAREAQFSDSKPTTERTNNMANTAALEAEIARLRARLENKSKLTLKVSQKGAVSLYGMGRFPITLYKEQWARVIENAPTITEFLAENDHALKAKGD